MQLAPVALFVYNRPWHTEQTLNALAANELAAQSELFIYADGPKDNADAATLENIRKTRQVILKKQWCKEVYIIEQGKNQGLQASVIGGVTTVVNNYGSVIVLEDDIVTSPFFLQYMNDALRVYQQDEKVLSIGALNFFATDDEVGETFFVPVPDCWGWATWNDRWALFEPNPQKLLDKLRERGLINKFNLGGAFNFERLLVDQIKGDISSWAIRWQAVAYLEEKLSLYPRCSVTRNIGFGPGGTHGGDDRVTKHIKFATKRISVIKMPVEENPSIIKKMNEGYKRTTLPEKSFRIKLAVRNLIKTLIPPAASLIYRKMKPHKKGGILWQGNFPDWEAAKAQCSGYDDPLILEKTKNAILKVKNGEAAGERDSVLFDKVQYCWPLATFLLRIALENNNNLSVIDFGGSLGSSYFQNKDMVPPAVQLSWAVVEQRHYVDAGNAEIKDEQLRFYYTIREAVNAGKPNVLLLSGVLHYLEDPFKHIEDMLSYNFAYIIVDRTAFIENSDNRITVQQIPESIYKASYPAWFFNEHEFTGRFKEKYNLVAEFEGETDMPSRSDDNINLYWKGFLFKLKDA